MFKIDNKTNKISITKGDNASLRVNLIDVNKVNRPVFDDDTIVLTVRKNVNDITPTISKTAVNGVISFNPDDTKDLDIGLYVYDIQLTTFDNKIYTVIPLAYFDIKEEVTR